jgi:hypothetical protein
MAKPVPRAATETVSGFQVRFGTPRRLPRPDALAGRVAVLDIAFASESGGNKNGFERTTLRFIEGLGTRLRAWVDHHDSRHHHRFASDPRFLLTTKSEHGACPELVTPELVARAGPVETLVCHGDFDGLASGAKWILGGREPYAGADDDARAIDTRTGTPGPVAGRIDRALRARPRDETLMMIVVRLLVGGASDAGLWREVDAAAAESTAREREAERLSARFEPLTADLVLADVTRREAAYDRTALLLLGQRRARMAAVLDGDTVTFAAPFDSGVDFLERFGLSGGMPTLVSLHRAKLAAALRALGVPEGLARRYL